MKSICLVLISSLTVIFLFGNIYVSHATPANNFDSLVAYYPFNGNTNDESGNNLHLTNHGAVLTADRFGTENNAYLFNGSATISCTDDDLLDITSDFTISFWVKNPGSVLHQFVMSKHTAGEDNTGSWGIASYGEGNTYSFVATPHWGFGPPNPTTPIISENNWHHITFIYKKATSEWKSFLDGSLVNSGTQDFSIQNTGKDFMIGSCMGYNLNLMASLDDIRIYNVAMTDSEVQNLYNYEADGLVAYYPFNGNANDESGNGSNPTYIGTGVTLTSDRFGNPNKAYYFDGNASSYIRMPADKFPTTDRTISFWFNADKIENHPTPLSYGGDVCYNSLLMIINKGDYPNAYTVLSHCASNFISATYSEAPINKWYYLTMTISGSTQKIFINGELQQSVNTFTTPTVVAGKSAVLGAILFTDGVTVYNEPTAGNFKGKMDDFRFYNIALTDTEVKNLYNNESSGLVAYYPFDGNVKDESGNGNNGTGYGATLTHDRFGINGKAYRFDGANDFISIPDNPYLFSDEMTISWWYKLTEVPGAAAVVIGWVDGGHRYQQFFSGGELNYFNGYNVGDPGIYFNPIITLNDLNVWKNVLVTYKKLSATTSSTSIFVNGSLKQTDTHSLTMDYAPGIDLLIGKNHNGNYFKGELDDINIFSRSLTDQEIKDLFLKETKPVLQYPENQSSLNTLTPEMRWSSPVANGEFTFQLSSDSLFGSILHELVTNNLSTQLPGALLTEGQNYYWRVRSTLNGETGPWSPVWSFNYVNTGLAIQTDNAVTLRIYPSPADASVKIIYSLSKTTNNGTPVTLEIVNSIGKSIKKLAEKSSVHGNIEIEVETGSLPSGIYYCRLKVENNLIMRKVVIIH